MFCKKGKCEGCGLFTEVILRKDKGAPKSFEMCIFTAMFESQLRLEGRMDGLHAAVNSDRNAVVNSIAEVQSDLKRSTEATNGVKDMIGHGFLALAQKVEEHSQGQEADLKLVDGGNNDGRD